MIGSVDVKTRPLRLAYLIDPRNAAQIREAIRVSSSLWGGTYFPMLPVYKRMPNTWAETPFKPPKPDAVLRGYMEAFDPDVLVQFSTEVPPFIAASGVTIVPPQDIWSVLETARTLSPRFGIGIFEVLGDIFEKSFRYKAKYPVKVMFPQVPRELSLFWASVFGEVPPTLKPILDTRFREPLEMEEAKFTVDKLAEFMAPDMLFPRRIAQYGLTHVSRAGFRREARAFFLDATKTEDIIDFWNLRALGQAVLAVPKQLQGDAAMKGLLVNFLKAHRIPWPHNPKVHDYASMVRSRNCTMEEMQEFSTGLTVGLASGDASADPLLSLQHWYPRIWDEWARDKDGAVPDDVYTEEEQSFEIGETSDLSIRLKPALPDFAEKHAYHDAPRCANDISFHVYGADQYFAEVFPKSSGSHVMRAIGGMASWRGDWRISRSRLVRLVKHDIGERRTIPLAEDVMCAWLADLGWKPKLSAPGLLAKQIFTQLEGQMFALHNEALLGLLEHMNGGMVNKDGSPVTDNAVTPELERDLPIGEVKKRLATERGNVYDYLLSKGVFRLGNRVQCPHCVRKSWFPLQGIQESLTCPRCLRVFPALGNLTSGTWSYKTTGPFSVPAYAEGAYAVLLTLEFFNDQKMSTMHTTPLLSFTAEAPGKGCLEADCALLWEESVYGEQKGGVLFCECKTYGQFGEKDFDRVRYLAKTFPGAILVFSTLRKSLTKDEIAKITRIARAGRKYWRPERPINPVLILTGTELLDWQGPPYCWAEPHSKKFDHIHGLLKTCDATQQIYLNLPSWEADWQRKWEKGRKRRSKA